MKKLTKGFKAIVQLVLIISLIAGTTSAFANSTSYGNDNQNYISTSDGNNSHRDIEEEVRQPVSYDVSPTYNYFGARYANSSTGPAVGTLEVESVQIVAGGNVRAKYYSNVFTTQGSYYLQNPGTVDASMTDARIFNVKVTLPKGTDYSNGVGTGANQFDASKVAFTYGDKALGEWKKFQGSSFGGDAALTIVPNSVKAKVEDENIIVNASVKFDAFYNAGNSEDQYNIPYADYVDITKSGYSIIKNQILGAYALSLRYNSQKNYGSKNIKLNLYDSFHRWSELEADILRYKQQAESGGNRINNKYVSITSIGKSAGFSEGDGGLNSAPKEIWNAVIAKSASDVNTYLNSTKEQMLTDPESLKNNLAGAKIPLYFNNVHPDETPGADALFKLFEDIVNKDSIDYKVFENSGITHTEKTSTSRGFYTANGNAVQIPKNLSVSDILDKFIIVITFTENPDGRYNLQRTNGYYFDLNRDAAYQTQPEVRALTRDIVKWEPLTMIEYHGYVQQLLIEPCTGPHDPNYEYDLYEQPMLKLGKAMGNAITGNTPYSMYHIPATDRVAGWDDGAPVYGPMFAMEYGTLGYTLEIPFANYDSLMACYTSSLELIKYCAENFEELYKNKLEFKRRGVENEDRADLVDPLLKDPFTGEVVGRPREDGKPFFPEYYVIPVDKQNQKNVLEAYKTAKTLSELGVKVSKTTSTVVADGVTYPAGTFVVDMHQANRAAANFMLYPGFDGSAFEGIYAELVVSYPHLRGFDALPIYEAGKFSGVLTSANTQLPATSINGGGNYVVIKNNNIDAIKLVNKLLKSGKEVKMALNTTAQCNMGDFIANTADVVSNTQNLYIEATAYNLLIDVKFKEIKMPKINIYGSDTHLSYIMDLLGFERGSDYAFVTRQASQKFSEPNVVLANNLVADTTTKNEIKSYLDDGAGYVGVNNGAYSSTVDNINKGSIKLASDILNKNITALYAEDAEVLAKGTYANDSIITANYSNTNTVYSVGGYVFDTIPETSKVLMQVSNEDDFFIAGWAYNMKDIIKGKALAIQDTYSTPTKGDVPVTLFSTNIFSKAHSQYAFNMFANALYSASSQLSAEPEILPANGFALDMSSVVLDPTNKSATFTAKGNNMDLTNVEWSISPASEFIGFSPAGTNKGESVTVEIKGEPTTDQNYTLTAKYENFTATASIKVLAAELTQDNYKVKLLNDKVSLNKKSTVGILVPIKFIAKNASMAIGEDMEIAMSEVDPQYSIKAVKLYNGATESTDFTASPYDDSNILIELANTTAKTTKDISVKYLLKGDVDSATFQEAEGKLEVAVINAAPSVTLQSEPLDIFYFDKQAAIMVITASGGEVVSIDANSDVVLSNGKLQLLETATAGSKTINAKVRVNGFDDLSSVKLSYKITETKIKLKLNPSKVIFEEGTEGNAFVELYSTDKNFALQDMKVSSVTGSEGVDIGGYDVEKGIVQIYSTSQVGNGSITVNFNNSKKTIVLPINITKPKTVTPKITARIKNFTVNYKQKGELAKVNLITTPTNLNLYDSQITITPDISDVLDCDIESNSLSIKVKDGKTLPRSGKYKISVVHEGEKKISLDINMTISSNEPSLTVSLKNKIDIINPNSAVTGTLKFKDTSDTVESIRLLENAFESQEIFVSTINKASNTFLMQAKTRYILPKIKRTMFVEAKMSSGNVITSKPITVTPVQGSAKAFANTKELVLSKEEPINVSNVSFSITSPIGAAISKVIIDPKSNKDNLFELIENDATHYQFGFRDGTISEDANVKKSYSIKFLVYPEGTVDENGVPFSSSFCKPVPVTVKVKVTN